MIGACTFMITNEIRDLMWIGLTHTKKLLNLLCIVYICLFTLFINLTICFKRGIEDFELGAIKYFSNFHHCLGDRESDFNLVDMLSLNDCFDSRMS